MLTFGLMFSFIFMFVCAERHPYSGVLTDSGVLTGRGIRWIWLVGLVGLAHATAQSGPPGVYFTQPASQTFYGGSGMFRVTSAQTLPAGVWAVSLFRDHVDRDPKDVSIDSLGAAVAYGLAEHAEVFGRWDLFRHINVGAPAQTGVPLATPGLNSAKSPYSRSGLGDIYLGAKWRHQLDPHLIAGLMLTTVIPAADANKGLGTGQPAVTLSALNSQVLSDKLALHYNFGFTINPRTNSYHVGQAVVWGAALDYAPARRVELVIEYVATRSVAVTTLQSNPTLDVTFGPTLRLSKTVFLRPGITWNPGFQRSPATNAILRQPIGWNLTIGRHPGVLCCD